MRGPARSPPFPSPAPSRPPLLLPAAAGGGAGPLTTRAGGRTAGPLASPIAVLATAMPFLVVLAPELLAGGGLNPYRLIAPLIAVIAAGVANRQI